MRKQFAVYVIIVSLLASCTSGEGSNNSNSQNTGADDMTPPAPVSLLNITESTNNTVNLSWSNPADVDFSGVVVVRSTNSMPQHVTDGDVVYTGTGTTYIDNSVSEGKLYYYSLFSFDSVPNYSAPISGSAVPVVIPPNLPSAREGHAAVVFDGEIYIIGGYNGGYLSSVYIYNPVTNTWRSGLPILRRTQLTAATAAGVVYAIAGRTISAGGSVSDTNWVEAYNGTTLLWSRVANYPISSWKIDSIVYNNDIYTFGGTPYKYTTSNNIWSPISLTINYGGDHCSAQINGKVYVTGGTNVPDAMFIYDISHDTWSAGANLPIMRFRHSCIAYGGKLYLFGGESITPANVHYLPITIDIYDPALDQWRTSSTALASGRQELTASVLGDYVYLIGGNTQKGGSGGVYLNTVEKFYINDL